MIKMNKITVVVLFASLSSSPSYAMDKHAPTITMQENSNKKSTHPTDNNNCQKRRSNPRTAEREKTIQLNRERNKKLYRYFSSDDHL